MHSGQTVPWKYLAILELEECHGGDVGFAYWTKDSVKIFIQHTAENQRQSFFAQEFSSVSFFSFLMDGSTDASSTENELIMIVSGKKDDKDKRCSCVLGMFPWKLHWRLIQKTYRLTKLWIMKSWCSKPLSQGISVTCSQLASCCGWRDRWGIIEYSRAKWNKRKVAKGTFLAFLDMVLCTQVRASM